ncbi:MAG: tungsten cofactor oxidoreductase radical SAM maturase [Anaerolineaceae bacterium]|nr:tungsten cofactor oxidoreductase radical SAM maturase [Anaerolineaceae bacterium]
MPNILTDSNGRLILPKSFLQRRHLPANVDFWLNEREGDLILHPRLPNARKLYIEATTACNLQCRTCIRNIWSDPIAAMKRETFDRILESLPGLPELNRIVFTSFGESLTHPSILDMIEAVRARGLAVTLGTNGLLLTSKVSAELVRLGVDRIVVSLDGVSPDIYENVRGTDMSEVLHNLHSLNEAKYQLESLIPTLGIEFVALKSNVHELGSLTRLASHLKAARVLVSNVLPYTEDILAEVLYGYEPQAPFMTGGFPVRADAWVTWGTLELPHMHWGAERRCRFVNDRSMVVGWDGEVSPCYALSHNYSYYAIDGRKKDVSRYQLGNVHDNSLADIWMSEDYTLFRSEVRIFHFPSCPDCDLRDTCDLRGENEGCWGWNPSCADCLWAQDIIRCP